MHIDPDILMRILRLMKMIDLPSRLLDSEGDVILPEDVNYHYSLPQQISNQRAVPIAFENGTIINVGERTPYYLFIEAPLAQASALARLACESIRAQLNGTARPRVSEDHMLRYILHQGTGSFEAAAMGQQLGIADDVKRYVLCVRLISGAAIDALIPVVVNSCDAQKDISGEMGYSTIAIVHTADEDETPLDVEQYAEALENSIEMETGARVLIGISRVCNSFSGLADAYTEAGEAVDVGKKYHPQMKVFRYSALLPERLLDRVPEKEAAAYYSELFNTDNAKVLNEETLHDIEILFENSLNLSETARRLYIHRNTLMYRLDKVEKATGLDLKSFHDAMTFRMLLLLGKDRGDTKNKG